MTHYLKLCSVFLFGVLPLSLMAEELYFVDAHSQVDHQLDELNLILKRMD